MGSMYWELKSREGEPGINIFGDLGEIFLYSKRWVRSATTDSKKVMRSLTTSTLSLLSRKQVIGP